MMRVMAVSLMAMLASVARGQDGPPAAGEVLSLDEAVKLSLQGNRSIQNAALQVKRADADVGAAKAQRLPVFDVQVLAGRTLSPVRITVPGGAFGEFESTGPIPSQDTVVDVPAGTSALVSASVAQPLSQLYKVGLGVKSNELSRDIDREKLRAERASVVNEVKRLYYTLVQHQSALQAAEDQVKTYRELDRVVAEYVSRETALPADRLDVQAQLRAGEYKVLSLRNALATEKERMNSLLGRELDYDFSLAAIPEASFEEVDLEAAVAHAIERRPELRQARLQVDQADTGRRIKKAEYIPDVSLAVTYLTFTSVHLNVAQVGMQLKWQPFDFGRGKELAASTLQLEQAKLGVRETESQVRIDVASRVRKLHEARELLEAQRIAREAAREKLRVTTKRYETEAALLKDALQAQATLGDANAEYDEALLGVWTARSDLEKALGEDP